MLVAPIAGVVDPFDEDEEGDVEDEDGNDGKVDKDDVGTLKGSDATPAPVLLLVWPFTCTPVWA